MQCVCATTPGSSIGTHEWQPGRRAGSVPALVASVLPAVSAQLDSEAPPPQIQRHVSLRASIADCSQRRTLPQTRTSSARQALDAGQVDQQWWGLGLRETCRNSSSAGLSAMLHAAVLAAEQVALSFCSCASQQARWAERKRARAAQRPAFACLWLVQPCLRLSLLLAFLLLRLVCCLIA